MLLGWCSAVHAAAPNVILIMTDDQGYGDFGITGNRLIHTPNLDAMAVRSTWMRTFYVSPVCSPTRANLMTGRYNYRTRCIDTYLGRSMMDPGEVTIAEVLHDAGYATGIFGKWHLGDCYPMRPIDQGFEEALVLRGGGLGQPADPIGNDRRYTDPILMHNGQPVQTTGYCTDVYFDAALDWMERMHAADQPFFAYIPTNAPHGPFHDVPVALRKKYEWTDWSRIDASSNGSGRKNLAEIAAMITNVDDNIGRLFTRLDALGITNDTLVIFLVDNGPNTTRYAGPFRGQKSQVYEGGVRSPFWMHWPGRLTPGYARDEPVAHIDVMPTILEACGVAAPADVQLDGRSFWGLATGKSEHWPSRPLVLQTHRGDEPVRFHQFMIRHDRWKLLHASGFGRESFDGPPRYELYDVVADPGETRALNETHPDVVERLLAEYETWFDDVSTTRPENYAPPRIHIGTPHEDTTVLTRQDWRGGTWQEDSIGYWLVRFEPGRYDARVHFTPGDEPGVLKLRLGTATIQARIPSGATACTFRGLSPQAGDTEVHAVIAHGDRERGVYQIEVSRN
jgi:arylsulfatase/arylsulfatase A